MHDICYIKNYFLGDELVHAFRGYVQESLRKFKPVSELSNTPPPRGLLSSRLPNLLDFQGTVVYFFLNLGTGVFGIFCHGGNLWGALNHTLFIGKT